MGKGVDGDSVEFGVIDSEISEDQDAMIFVLCDDDVVVLIDCHSPKTVELTRTPSLRSKGPDVIPLIIKDLNSVVVVANNDDTILFKCHTSRIAELTRS